MCFEFKTRTQSIMNKIHTGEFYRIVQGSDIRDVLIVITNRVFGFHKFDWFFYTFICACPLRNDSVGSTMSYLFFNTDVVECQK